MKLAFLGMGRMGQGMAGQLLRAGHALTVYNRTAEKTAHLEKTGAQTAKTPREAVDGADVVFTMLADDAALAATMEMDTVGTMATGGIHVSMSTISKSLAASMAESHAAKGRCFLGCPVFGRPDAAASGSLRLCLSGSAGPKEKVRPLLACLGEIWDFGEIPASALAVKLAGNFMIATCIEMLGEAYSLVEKNGVPPESFYTLMASTLFAAPAFQNYGRIILKADFDNAGFAAKLGAKDIRLLREAARDSATPMPFAAVLEERLTRVLARQWGEKDWSVIANIQREDAGI